jgi:DNA polymerase III epsilon subunit family exonuclease
MDWLTTLINKEFGNEYSFLKLLEVNYDKNIAQCVVTFLYPNNQSFDDENKELITNFIKSKLSLFAKVVVKFKKSYLDNSLIEKAFFEVLKTEYPAIYALSEKKHLNINNEFNNISIFFDIDKNSIEYLNADDFKIKLKKILETKFCCEFTINLNPVESNLPVSKIEQRTSNSFKIPKVARYEVKILYNIFGGEVTPKPEFIKHLKQEKSSVILAGKIENLKKKSYESKRQKTKGQIKFYYCFELNDTISKIDVKYFTTRSNEKKMDKLVNGDEVLILGDVKSFNNKLSLYITSISKCQLPEKIELPVVFSNEYELIKPEKYSILTQENLFKKNVKYTDEIYQNTYVVFDVETTGLDPENDELVEIGAVKIENGLIVSKFVTLIKPASPIPISATLINNITNEMVANCPKVDVAIRDFYRFTRDAKMIGYNVAFDQRFIQKAAKQQGLIFDNEFIDVLPLARARLSLTRYKLTDVVKRLDISLEGAHRAFADALATAETFLELNSSNYA